MKRRTRQFGLIASFILTGISFSKACAETETIDLIARAKKARPAVMLLVVSDATGKEIATGTGFLVSSDGKLITNHHVIEGGASAVAKAENGGLFPIEGVLADDPKNDLVLLKLKGKDLPFLPLGNTEKIEVGTRIAIIGSPLGLEGTLSEGIVSAVRELLGDMKVLQVTAAISPGSSGSPVLNAKGDVIGIATLLLTGGQALNFAVPAGTTHSLLRKADKATALLPLSALTTGDQEKVFGDPDYRALVAADAVEDYPEMLKRAQVLVRRYPRSALPQFVLGIAYRKLRFLEDAAEANRQAIKLKPDYVNAWVNLGAVCNEQRKSDEAEKAARVAIKLAPDLAEAWLVLGAAQGEQAVASGTVDKSKFEESIPSLERAVKLKPDHAAAWHLWVSIIACLAGWMMHAEPSRYFKGLNQTQLINFRSLFARRPSD